MIQLAIFATGTGSNTQKIIEHFRSNRRVQIGLIVCNKQGAGVVNIGRQEGIPVLMIEKNRFFEGDGYLPVLQKAAVEWIVLAGFLWKLPAVLLNAFPRRILNLHPALLPKYGGKGMYGTFVHKAVLEARDRQSGITIHYVDEHYDHGDIIFQATCTIDERDTPETLAAKVHILEHKHYPRVIEEVLNQAEGK